MRLGRARRGRAQPAALAQPRLARVAGAAPGGGGRRAGAFLRRRGRRRGGGGGSRGAERADGAPRERDGSPAGRRRPLRPRPRRRGTLAPHRAPRRPKGARAAQHARRPRGGARRGERRDEREHRRRLGRPHRQDGGLWHVAPPGAAAAAAVAVGRARAGRAIDASQAHPRWDARRGELLVRCAEPARVVGRSDGDAAIRGRPS